MSTNVYGMDLYQQFIHKSRYARWDDSKKRRETWNETVARYFDFFTEYLSEEYNYELTVKLRTELEKAVLNLDIMPSMRALMTAGPALKRENISGYNCSYIKVDHPRSFDEILYVLMNGTGVGFSVEREYVGKLPTVADEMHDTDTTIIVPDSKLGWAKSFKELVNLLYVGQIPKWDMSRVRPAGAPLKTFGGRASGPEPLEELFKFVVKIFRSATGRKLSSLECHDLVCKIAEVVVVGGVRRSALISLSDLSDERMRKAKVGQWWVDNVQRSLSNNSVCYKERPEIGIFMKEWLSLYESKSGERGIFNRVAAQKQSAKNERRESDHDFGTNPCSEIILRSREFCNLTEVVIRRKDTLDDLKRKIRLATILGTFQSTLTNFKYVSKEWKKNCAEERLLGVSLTGIMDHGTLSGTADKNSDWYQTLREEAVSVNKKLADEIGIEQSAAITCTKPSGTVSQLVDSSSGIHARYSPYYIRTVRADNKDPLCKYMKENGFPHEPDVTKPESTTVFSFPQKSPKGSIMRDEMSAVEQLEHWLVVQRFYCEHKPSITVFVKEDEWLAVGSWVYDHFNEVSGVSFLPHSDHSYQQAPYTEISKEKYEELSSSMPKEMNWDDLAKYEESDLTAGAQTVACSAGICELVDL